jgi:3-phenylpropionate/trans-cinnamate dioxygenase ferredoxin subunit
VSSALAARAEPRAETPTATATTAATAAGQGARQRTRYVVARAEEIRPGERRIALAGRVSIGVFNVDGEFYALANVCPHMGAPLCLGPLTGTNVPSEPSTYVWDEEGRILRCPWHKWEFDVRTGESLFDPQVRTRAYRVAVEDGDVAVYV